MDLIDVQEIRVPSARSEIVIGSSEKILAGGTWLFSVPETGLTGLVDITRLGWAPVTRTASALVIAATCTVAELSRLTPPALRTDPVRAGSGYESHTDPYALFWHCANSFLASYKIWNIATVGGNIALALPAGPMISLAASLDAEAVIWMPSGGERRMPVADLVTGVMRTALEPREVLREIVIPFASLDSRTGFRRIALNDLGRTGTLVIARVAPTGETVFTVTGGTSHPVQLRFDGMPSAPELQERVLAIDCWYDDAHGSSDWRRAMSVRFAEQLRLELA
ncbi:FAD binding domain-containing protein [Frigoribacterium sp. CG_9.8]|uniref:FAD binding domain-containing protein n=1 Tax=Frigoribacterium sp. CG_9.8 TaxID=2787733 RepID=UPI001A33B715|nr:FAD binding domain-containing protein [Frigoribacterium sp. CG_9.8]MBG6106873.1 CO/xanthine dehydrogenase FAD-binding subunit [Frigoribacterium sp. CG_9.8]